MCFSKFACTSESRTHSVTNRRYYLTSKPIQSSVFIHYAAFMARLAVWSLICHASLSFASPSREIAPADIVEKADRIRFPADGFQVDVKITNIDDGRETDTRLYRVLSKGSDKSLVMTMSPAVDKGQILLMRDNDLWLFMPSVSQPLRLPMSQRLTGQVANGDLARVNFSGNYESTLLRKESVDGRNYYVLELLAAKVGVTYHRVIYWVNEKNYRPLKAEFYTRSNRLSKTCTYENYKNAGGEVRPLRLVMEDALRKGEKSILDYRNITERRLPDKIFTKDYLKKLQ